jgi:hypothetical protein
MLFFGVGRLARCITPDYLANAFLTTRPWSLQHQHPICALLSCCVSVDHQRQRPGPRDQEGWHGHHQGLQGWTRIRQEDHSVCQLLPAAALCGLN